MRKVKVKCPHCATEFYPKSYSISVTQSANLKINAISRYLKIPAVKVVENLVNDYFDKVGAPVEIVMEADKP